MATFLLSNTLGPELFPLPLTCLLPFKICNMEPRLAKQSLRMTVIKWCIFQSSKVEPSGGAVLQMQWSCKLTYLVDRIQQRFPFSLELNEYCLLPLFVSARVPFFLLLASHPNVETGIINNLPNVRSEETSLLPPASVLRPPPPPLSYWELATAFAQLTDMGSKKKRNCNWEYFFVPSGHPQGGGGGAAASAPEGTEGAGAGEETPVKQWDILFCWKQEGRD